MNETLKWNSRKKATKASFVIEYESNLHVSIIMTKEAILRFTVVSFSGKLIVSGVWGHC